MARTTRPRRGSRRTRVRLPKPTLTEAATGGPARERDCARVTGQRVTAADSQQEEHPALRQAEERQLRARRPVRGSERRIGPRRQPDQPPRDRLAQDREPGGESRRGVGSRTRDCRGECGDGHFRSEVEDISGQDIRHGPAAGPESDDRRPRPGEAPQERRFGGRRILLEDPYGDGGAERIPLHGDGSGLAALRERGCKLARPRARQRDVRLAGLCHTHLPDEGDDRPDADPERHQRRLSSRPRAWIACSTPTATRFATIDEPPTVTKASGIPVTGAMPIVIPTLTNT